MREKVDVLQWNDNKLTLIDQRKLPHVEEYVVVTNIEKTHKAIKDMVVRGAPLIGSTALYGLVLFLKSGERQYEDIIKAADYLKTARPTAVNLEYEVNKVVDMSKKYKGDELTSVVENYASLQMKELGEKNLQMAKIAEDELNKKFGTDKKLRLMTLCNTGFLACGPMGTALGVISYMNEIKRVEHVYASETRPYLQGSRLTAYELYKEEIPHSIVVEGAASYLLGNAHVDAIFIGADRIVRNGDTANKVGSSSLAIIANHYGIPFYVVAPQSSFDYSLESGKDIEIELRPESEVLSLGDKLIAPKESRAMNPSFDVTDHRMISGIICENGIAPGSDFNAIQNLRSQS